MNGTITLRDANGQDTQIQAETGAAINLEGASQVSLPFGRSDIQGIQFDGAKLELSLSDGSTIVLDAIADEEGTLVPLYDQNGDLLFANITEILSQLEATAAGPQATPQNVGGGSGFTPEDDTTDTGSSATDSYRDLRGAGTQTDESPGTGSQGNTNFSAAPNIAPIAVNDSFSFDEVQQETPDMVGNLLLNDSDLDSSPDVVELFVETANGEAVDPATGTTVTLESGLQITVFANGLFVVRNHVEIHGDLAEGQQKIDQMVYTVSDGQDASEATLTVTVTGTNDQPVITLDEGDSDSESIDETNEGLTVQGTLTLDDNDVIDSVSVDVTNLNINTSEAIEPLIAEINLESMLSVNTTPVINSGETSGIIAWNFDSQAQAFDFLSATDTLELTYTITATDTSGTETATTSHDVTVIINGTNDTPIITAATTANATETADADAATDANPFTSFTGAVSATVTDVDTNDSWSYVALTDEVATVTDTYGVITGDVLVSMGTDGQYTISNDSFNNLGDGETITISFDIQVQDDSTDSATDTSVAETVTLTLTGSNDTPIITAATTANATETADADAATDANPFTSFTGAVSATVTDVDTNDSWSYVALTDEVATVTDTYGVITGDVLVSMGTDGQYTISNDSFNNLGDGETITISFDIQVQDDSTDSATDTSVAETVTLTLTGSNDIPILSSLVSTPLEYTENDPATILDGILNISDVDNTNMEGATIQISGNYESDEDILNIAQQQLADGVTASWDGESGTLTLNGTASKSDYESMLEHVTYRNTSEAPSDAQRTVSWTVNDGFDDSAPQFSYINVTPENDRPVIDSTTPDELWIDEDSVPATTDILSTVAAHDVDGTQPTFTIITGNSDGYFHINNNGEITLTDHGRSEISGSEVNDQNYLLNVQVSDNELSSNTWVTVHVQDNQLTQPTINISSNPEHDSGTSQDDNLTNVRIPTFDLGDIDVDVLNITVAEGMMGLAQANRSDDDGFFFVWNTLEGSLAHNGTNWTYTPNAPLDDGQYEYTVNVSDDGGNTSSSTIRFEIDGTAPAQPSIDLTPNTEIDEHDTNIDGDNVTYNTTPDVDVSVGDDAKIGDIIKVFVGGIEVGTTVLAAAGAQTVSVATNLTLPGVLDVDGDSNIAIQATLTDVAGNESDLSSNLNIRVDTVAPTAPVITKLTNGTDTGANNDGITSDTTPTVRVSLGSDIEIGDTVQIMVGDTVVGTQTVSYNNLYKNNGDLRGTPRTFVPTDLTGHLDEDGDTDLVLTAQVIDIAGNEGPKSVGYDVRIDEIAPAAPSLILEGDDSFINIEENLDGIQFTVNLNGSAEQSVEVDDVLTLYVEYDPLRDGPMDGNRLLNFDGTIVFEINTQTVDQTILDNGSFTFTETTPDDGTYTVYSTVTDVAGNESELSPALTFIQDTVAPLTIITSNNIQTEDIVASGDTVATFISIDAHAVTYSIDDTTHFAIDPLTGEITLTADGVAAINAETYGEDLHALPIVVTATDAAGNTTPMPLTIDVNRINDNAPEFTLDTQNALTEDSVTAGDVVATFTGLQDLDDLSDGETLTFSIDDTTHFAIDPLTGEITLTADGVAAINAETYGEDLHALPIVVTATDAAGNTTPMPLTIDVNRINDNAPTFTVEPISPIEEGTADGSVIVDIDATDVDDGDSISYSIVSGNDDGYFDIDPASGEITLTSTGISDINNSQVNDASFNLTVRASDTEHDTDEIVTINVQDTQLTQPSFNLSTQSDTGVSGDSMTKETNPVLDIATLDADVVMIQIKDSSDNVVATASRPDVNSTWSKDTTALNLNAGKWTYQPSGLGNGENTFTVEVHDDGGNLNSQVVSFDVDNVQPVFLLPSATFDIDEDTTSVGNVGPALDPNGITYSIGDGLDGALFDIDPVSGDLNLISLHDFDTPAADSYQVIVVATDDAGNTTPKLFTVNINDINDETPVINTVSSVDQINENTAGAVIRTFTISDADAPTTNAPVGVDRFSLTGADAALFEIVTGTNPGEFDLKLINTESPDFETGRNSYDVKVTYNDGVNNSDEVDSFVRVVNLNDEDPSFTGPVDLGSGNEDADNTGALTINFTEADLLAGASDADNGAENSILSATNVTTSVGSLSGDATNGWSVSVPQNFFGTVTISYEVADGANSNAAATATYEVVSVNDIPVINSVTTLPTANEVVFHYNPEETGNYQDQSGNNRHASEVGSSGIFSTGNHSTINTGSYNFKTIATSFTTAATAPGTDQFQVIYEQGGGSNGYSIAMVGTNLYAFVWGESFGTVDPSHAVIDLGSVTTGTRYSIVMVHDAEGQNGGTLTAYLDGIQTGAVVEGVGAMGSHSGAVGIGGSNHHTVNPTTPTANDTTDGDQFNGTIHELASWNAALNADQVADVVSYLTGTTDTAISIDETTDVGTVLFSVDANDVESTVQFSLDDDHGSLFAIDQSGNVKVNGALDFETEDQYSLVIRASDGIDSATSTVTVNVVDINEAPGQISLTSTGINENAVGATVGTLNAVDPEGNSLTYSVSDNRFTVESGELKLRSGESLNYEALGGDGTNPLTLTLTVSASDGLNTTTNSVSFDLNDLDEDPVAQDLHLSTDEGSSVALSSLVTVHDEDIGDNNLSLPINGVGSASNGTVTFGGSNYTYTPDFGFSGNDSFSYTTVGGYTATVYITVNPLTVDGVDAVNDLVGHWMMSGNVNEEPSTGNVIDNGSLLNDAAVTNGILVLDGTNDRVEFSNSTDLNSVPTNERSISLWFNTEDGVSKQYLWGEGGGTNAIQIYMENGVIYAQGYSDSLEWKKPATIISSDAIDYADGNWHNVTVSVAADTDGGLNTSGFKLYVDGTLEDSDIAGTLQNHNPAHIGSDYSNNNTFDGQIDDVRVYNSELTDSNVNVIFTQTKPVYHLDPADSSTIILDDDIELSTLLASTGDGGVSKINLNDVDHALTAITAADVLQIADGDTLVIDGDGSDTVNVLTTGEWTQGSDETVGVGLNAVTYNVFTNTAGDTTLKIDEDITSNLDPII